MYYSDISIRKKCVKLKKDYSTMKIFWLYIMIVIVTSCSINDITVITITLLVAGGRPN